jgi:hypothetical protein
MFQMTSGVTQLKRLVDCLGTSKDTIELRSVVAPDSGPPQRVAASAGNCLKDLQVHDVCSCNRTACTAQAVVCHLTTRVAVG